MNARGLLGLAIIAALAAGCQRGADQLHTGTNPELPKPHRGLLPVLNISMPAEWGDERPQVPAGYRIEAIATDLRIPRQLLVLPNGSAYYYVSDDERPLWLEAAQEAHRIRSLCP